MVFEGRRGGQAQMRLCPIITSLGLAVTNPPNTKGAPGVTLRTLELTETREDALHNLRLSRKGYSLQTLPAHSHFYRRNHSGTWVVRGKKNHKR